MTTAWKNTNCLNKLTTAPNSQILIITKAEDLFRHGFHILFRREPGTERASHYLQERARDRASFTFSSGESQGQSKLFHSAWGIPLRPVSGKYHSHTLALTHIPSHTYTHLQTHLRQELLGSRPGPISARQVSLGLPLNETTDWDLMSQRPLTRCVCVSVF